MSVQFASTLKPILRLEKKIINISPNHDPSNSVCIENKERRKPVFKRLSSFFIQQILLALCYGKSV